MVAAEGHGAGGVEGRCAGCGKKLERKTRGRARRLCSAACRQRGQRQRDKQKLSSLTAALPSSAEVTELRRKAKNLEQALHEAHQAGKEYRRRAEAAESQLRVFHSWLDSLDESNLIITRNVLLDCERRIFSQAEIPDVLKGIVASALRIADSVSVLLPAEKQLEIQRTPLKIT